jgi:hypothetical protein
MKMGTAPAWITILVCKEVPDAMLVRAHAASNCKHNTNVNINLLSVLVSEKGTDLVFIDGVSKC